MAKCHLFLSVYILFCCLCSAFPIFSAWKSVYGIHVRVFALFMCLRVESWSRCLSASAVTTAPTHPCRGIFPPFPPYLFLCVCYCSILFTTSPLLIFHSGRNTGQGWEGCPVPTLGLSHSQRNTPGRPNTLSTHAQCLVSLFDLHMSPSSSLIHRHTVELFESLGWGAVKHHCHCAGGLLVSGSYSCCSPL